MKASTIMSIQFISLVLIIGSAEGMMEEIFPSIIFALSFTTFALCSIYIKQHEKRLLRDTKRQYEEKEKLYRI